MEYAAITTPFALEHVRRSNMHMVLAHIALKDRAYRDFYRSEAMAGAYIIVDNGACEGAMPYYEDVLQVCAYIGAHEVALPDVLYDSKETVNMSKLWTRSSLSPMYKQMAVPQGTGWDEWADCLRKLAHDTRCEVIGIAKHLEKLVGGRAYAIELINSMLGVDNYHIHLLGVWEHTFLEMDEACGAYRDIRSIDTSTPIAAAQHNEALSNDVRHTIDWDAGVDDAYWFGLNLEIMRRHCITSSLGGRAWQRSRS